MPHTYTNLLYHLVFSTKYRAPIITDILRDPLYRFIGGLIREEDGSLIEIGGIEDHVHIVARLKPTLAIAEALRFIKASSSKWVNVSDLVRERFNWQVGYGAFTVSKSQLETVCRYVRNQRHHHRKKTFQEEFIELLQANEMDYDERYLWD